MLLTYTSNNNNKLQILLILASEKTKLKKMKKKIFKIVNHIDNLTLYAFIIWFRCGYVICVFEIQVLAM